MWFKSLGFGVKSTAAPLVRVVFEGKGSRHVFPSSGCRVGAGGRGRSHTLQKVHSNYWTIEPTLGRAELSCGGPYRLNCPQKHRSSLDFLLHGR